MAEDDTIEEGVLEQLVQKLEPCIERGELDACVGQLLQDVIIMSDNYSFESALIFSKK